VGLSAGLDRCGKSPTPGFEPRTVQSLYRLSYPGPHPSVLLKVISICVSVTPLMKLVLGFGVFSFLS